MVSTSPGKRCHPHLTIGRGVAVPRSRRGTPGMHHRVGKDQLEHWQAACRCTTCTTSVWRVMQSP
eukprot:13273606-Alexandrium_andersonii.AAC.1